MPPPPPLWRTRSRYASVVLAAVAALAIPALLLWLYDSQWAAREGSNARIAHLSGGGGSNLSSLSYVYFSDPMAGLGNKMFQYASGLALALRYGKRAILVADHPNVESMLEQMEHAFILTPLPRVRRWPRPTSIVAEAGWGRYDAAAFDHDALGVLAPGGFLVTGNLQSWRYFEPVAGAVRAEFRLTPLYEAAVATYFRRQRLPRGVAVVIGVHVRRGDMLRRPDLYTAAPVAYLRRAFDYYLSRYGGSGSVVFVVATDDRPWVEKAVANSLPPHLVVRYASGLTPAFDMAVLSRCNHSIITGGTFGWWSAWLAGGDVVYYRDFILPTSGLYASYNASDYYPPNWLGLV